MKNIKYIVTHDSTHFWFNHWKSTLQCILKPYRLTQFIRTLTDGFSTYCGWSLYMLLGISELPQGLIQAIKTIQCGKNYRNTLGCFDQENTLGCNSIFKFKYITNIVEDHITWSKIIKSHQNNNLTKTIVFHNIFIRQQIWIFYFQKVK